MARDIILIDNMLFIKNLSKALAFNFDKLTCLFKIENILNDVIPPRPTPPLVKY